MQAPVRLVIPNPRSSLETVHFGHLYVHQHHIEKLPLDGRENFLSVRNRKDGMTAFLEEPASDFLIDDIVFGK